MPHRYIIAVGTLTTTIALAMTPAAPARAQVDLFLPETAEGSAPNEPDAGGPRDGGTRPDGSRRNKAAAGASTASSVPPKAAGPGASDETVTLLSAADILNEARGVLRELERLDRDAQVDAKWKRLAQGLPERMDELSAAANKARQQIQHAGRYFDVIDVEYGFRQRRSELEPLLKEVSALSHRIADAQKRSAEILAAWTKTRREAAKSKASFEVMGRIADVLREARRVRSDLARRASVVLRVQASLGDMVDEINGLLDRASAGGTNLSRDLFRTGPGLIQTVRTLASERQPLAPLASDAERHLKLLRDFARASSDRIYEHVALTLAILALILWLRADTRKWSDAEHSAEAEHVVGKPIAATLLLSTICSLFIYPAMPAAVVVILLLVGILAVLRLVPNLFPWIPRAHLVALHVFLLLDLSRILIAEWDSLERLIMLGEGAAAAVYLFAIIRARAKEQAKPRNAWVRFQDLVLRFWLVSLGLGVLAGVVGFPQTGVILISAAVLSIFLTLVWAAGYRIAASAIDVGVHTEAAQRLNAFRQHGAVVTTRLTRVALLIFGSLWVRSVLKQYTLWDGAVDAVERALRFTVEAGTVKISVADVGILLLGGLVAVWAARFVRFVLEKDVMPRTGLGVGSQAAVSTSAYYALVAVGLFTAIAAAGFQLSKLTFLVGALGVGVGFGLQNVIQNFVAGLILIFSRPINVDDTIQLGDLIGKVKNIGFRASVVRSFQGAEVIVPNGQLISDQVINWTLSDSNRRIEVDIGVAYGTDPEKVLALLIEVARQHADILAIPAPEALFVNHGASSLDFQLRAWTGNSGMWPNIKSDLTVSINRALAAAGIEIPFPQRDLHLRSVDKEAAKALGGGSSGDG